MLDGRPASRERVGGKAASLSLLAASGCRVPRAFALTTEAYDEHVRGLHVPRLASLADEPDLQAIRETIAAAPVPSGVRDAIESGVNTLLNEVPGLRALAVRSSATTEDSAEYSFAGLHDTLLGIPPDVAAVEAAARQCWASLWTERSVDYRRRGGHALDSAAMGVVVQELVRSDVAFVAFTIDPVEDCFNRTIITASYGLGEAIVSGLVTPDTIVVNPDGTVASYDVGAKEVMIIPESHGQSGVREARVPRFLTTRPALSMEQAAEIASIARRLEEHYQTPLDIEGAVASDEIYLFQARPVTTCAGPSQASLVSSA